MKYVYRYFLSAAKIIIRDNWSDELCDFRYFWVWEDLECAPVHPFFNRDTTSQADILPHVWKFIKKDFFGFGHPFCLSVNLLIPVVLQNYSAWATDGAGWKRVMRSWMRSVDHITTIAEGVGVEPSYFHSINRFEEGFSFERVDLLPLSFRIFHIELDSLLIRKYVKSVTFCSFSGVGPWELKGCTRAVLWREAKNIWVVFLIIESMAYLI